jgi:hypothetical protein
VATSGCRRSFVCKKLDRRTVPDERAEGVLKALVDGGSSKDYFKVETYTVTMGEVPLQTAL